MTFQKWTLLATAALAGVSSIDALEIEFRYDLDYPGFFDQPGAKEALEAVGAFYEELIVDELEEINASTFPTPDFLPDRQWHPTYIEPDHSFQARKIPGARNLVVPANTIIVYVGGREINTAGLGGPGGFTDASGDAPPFDWSNQLYSRNEPGGLRVNSNNRLNTPRDIGPWGGAMFFDESRTWNFSTTDPGDNGTTDFLPIALHELMHVLGFGQFGSSTFRWTHLYDGASYTGNLGVESNAEEQPLLTSGRNHWRNSTPQSFTIAGFGRSHGRRQTPLMVPISDEISEDLFPVLTDLDLAALQDIGWEIQASPTALRPIVQASEEAVVLTFPTTTGTSYRIQKGNLGEEFTAMGDIIDGDGSLMSVPDPGGLASSAFYRVEATSNGEAFPQAMLQNPSGQRNDFALVAPQLAPSSCQCGHQEPN